MTGKEELHGGTAPLAALTTVFRPPCPTTWLLTTTKLPSQYPPFPSAASASCDPPSWNQNLDGAGFQYYSPAICPSGFVVGPSCDLRKTRTTEGFPSVAPGETVAYCVPAGLTCTTDTTDFRGGVWGFSRDGTEASATVTVGPAIQIRWVEDDLKILETHPLTPGRVLAETTTEVRTETTTRIVQTQPQKTETTTTKTELIQTATEQSPGRPRFGGGFGGTMTLITTTKTPTYQTFTTIDMAGPSPDIPQESGSKLTTDSVLLTDSSSLGIGPTGDIVSVNPTKTTSPAGSVSPTESSQSASGQSRGDGWVLDRGTSIVLIVMISLLVAIAIWVISFVLIRRHKAGKLTGLAPAALVRLGIRRGHVYHQRVGSASSTANMMGRDRSGRRETGFTELESGPLRGTTPNPAELEGRGIGDRPLRWSWISIVSRFFHAGRTGRQGSSNWSGRPSTARSGRSGEKPPTLRESFGEKINDPASFLAFPEALRTRSTLMTSSAPSTRSRGSSPWSRLSRDTFGVPKVPRWGRRNEQKVLVDGTDMLGLRKEQTK
ncbi:hypothetical protein V8F33_006647 [Rhypophila sp. PSN 637]